MSKCEKKSNLKMKSQTLKIMKLKLFGGKDKPMRKKVN